jgi:hypothetical protein
LRGSNDGLEFDFEVSKSLPDLVTGEKRRLSYLTNKLLGISSFRNIRGAIKVRLNCIKDFDE